MQRNFPVEPEPFVASLQQFFGAAATQDRCVLNIDTLRAQFFELMPYDRETIVEIIAHWQNDRSALGAQLGEAARTAHRKHPRLPPFPYDIVVAYTGNTLADAHRIILQPSRFEVPTNVWPADSLFEDYSRIIESRGKA